MRNHAHLVSFAAVCLLAVGGALGGVVSTGKQSTETSPALVSTPAETSVTVSSQSVATPAAEPAVEPAGKTNVEPNAGLVADSVCPPTIVVRIAQPVSLRSQPGGGGKRIGAIPAQSKYLGGDMWVPIREVSADGSSLLVDAPWAVPTRRGWIEDLGFERRSTKYRVRVSVLRRQLELQRDCKTVVNAPVGVGGASTPTPTGSSFVTDLTLVPSSQPQFGSFAFGLSATQPNLPSGWTGGDQMALHGTNQPASIGRAASTGCIRLSERTLATLQRYVALGTPVEIR